MTIIIPIQKRKKLKNRTIYKKINFLKCSKYLDNLLNSQVSILNKVLIETRFPEGSEVFYNKNF